jgi:beta-glucosidase
VVQVYLSTERTTTLVAFRRVTLPPGERARVTFTVGPRTGGATEPGRYAVSIGGKQAGFQGLADGSTTEVLTATLQVTR